MSVKEGESLILKTNAEIRKKDKILWLFGEENTLIAEIKEGSGKISTFDGVDGRFGGSLGLDINTGSLIIRNITTEHTGVYKQKIISKKGATIKRINVVVRGEYLKSFVFSAVNSAQGCVHSYSSVLLVLVQIKKENDV